MDLIRNKMGPGVSIIFSYYSPSVHKAATSYASADISEILPLDTRSSVRQVLDWIKPDVLIFVRYDTWPNLVWEAACRAIRLALVDALLRKGSSRVAGPIGRSFSRTIYSKFHYVGASAESDLERLRRICGKSFLLKMVGDSRLDRVKNRQEKSELMRIPACLNNKGQDVFVCGSTWPGDEARIVPALRRALDRGARFHTVIAPHEPTPGHLNSLRARLREHRLDFALYSELAAGKPSSTVTILDAVGFLAELYKVGTFVYVGGGFIRSGIHNTMEPAIMGLPLMLGPKIENSPEAEEMVRLGAAHIVHDSADVYQRILNWVGRPEVRKSEGEKARRFIESNLGASQRYCDDILGLLKIG
jgi:3-deoxy-D-manno-octulosonic-acid transferase